jgi:hypothetical protein
MCQRFCVLCCPVYVEAFLWVDLPARSPTKCDRIHFKDLILNQKMPEGLMKNYNMLSRFTLVS